MFQKFFTKTLESKFIKNLLNNTPLPIYKVVAEGDYIFKDSIYIYKDNIIQCTKSGYIGNYIWDKYTIVQNYKYDKIEGDVEFQDLLIATKADMDAIDETTKENLNIYYLRISDFLYKDEDGNVSIPVNNSTIIKLGYSDYELENANKILSKKYVQLYMSKFNKATAERFYEEGEIYVVESYTDDSGDVQPNLVFIDEKLLLKNTKIYSPDYCKSTVVFNKSEFDSQVKSKDLTKYPEDGIPKDSGGHFTDLHWYTLVSDKYDPADSGITEANRRLKELAAFKNVDSYIFGKYYPLFTEKHISEYGYYDPETHEKLGVYLNCLDKIFNLNLKPFYNCYSGRLADSIYFRKIHTYSKYNDIILPEGWILGDLTKDGIIDINDLDRIEGYLKGTTPLTEEEKWIADVNNDGIIDENDVIDLKDFIQVYDKDNPKDPAEIAFLNTYHFKDSNPDNDKKLIFKYPFIGDYATDGKYLYALNYTIEPEYKACLIRTADNITWEQLDDVTYNHISYFNNNFYCQTGNKILITSNIITPPSSAPIIEVDFTGKLQFINNLYLAFKDDLTNGINAQVNEEIIYYSADLENWTYIDKSSLPNGNYAANILFNNLGYIFLCDKIVDNKNKTKTIYYTQDFATWQSINLSNIITEDLTKPVQFFRFNDKFIIYAPTKLNKTFYYTDTITGAWVANKLDLDYYNPNFKVFDNKLFVFFIGKTELEAADKYLIFDSAFICKSNDLPERYNQKYNTNIIISNNDILLLPENLNAADQYIALTGINSKDFYNNWNFDLAAKCWVTKLNGSFPLNAAELAMTCDIVKGATLIDENNLYIWTELPPITKVTIPLSYSRAEYETINEPNTNFRVAQVPIKFNQTYTIAVDSNSEVTIAPAMIRNGRLVYTYNSDKSRIDLTKELNVSPITKNKSQFKQPFTYSVKLDPNKKYSDILETNEKNLYLLIQVPSMLNTSLVVLEGDYTLSDNCRKYFDTQLIDRLTDVQKNDLFTSTLSLLRMNSGSSYAFSNRLIEYLTLNVINHMDEIDQNITLAQTAQYLDDYQQISKGSWSDFMRCYYFNKVMDASSIEHIDMNGFIDKDTEKLFVQRRGN